MIFVAFMTIAFIVLVCGYLEMIIHVLIKHQLKQCYPVFHRIQGNYIIYFSCKQLAVVKY